MAPLQQVHLRFNDAAGQPTAVRLRVTDAAGQYYAPFGRLTHFATDPGVDVGANVLLHDEAWGLIDGACEVALPPGPLRIQARKGPEFLPLDADVNLLPGKMSLRFTLERWTNLAAEGWYSGDTCSYELSPHAALLEAQSQDLNVIDLLIREGQAPGQDRATGGLPARANHATVPEGSHGRTSRPWHDSDGDQLPILSNIAAYSGQHAALAKPNHLVVVNTANQSPHGRLLLLNTHRTIYPLSFQPQEKWSLIDWCDQCHRKKGLVIADDWLLRLADGPVPELLDPDFLRRVDAVRFHPNVPLTPWYDALQRGYKLPLVAGSGKESNRESLGLWRTYANVGDQTLDYANWTEAIRAGRTFVTNGPIVRWLPGGVVEAKSATPLDRVQILANGEVIAETTGPAKTLCVEGKAERNLVARCEGPNGALALALGDIP